MNNTDNLTEMFSLVGETEARTLTSTESSRTSQEADSCEELCPGEGLKAHIHHQVARLTLRAQLHNFTTPRVSGAM